ncbi:MAG TPA: YfbK domain-containing protein, partial [Planctomycetaceae bacterium]
IGLKGREIDFEDRPLGNLVFLLDVSGSMQDANKLPYVKEAMRMLVDRLGENDRVAIVVYAGAAGLVLPSTTADRREAILSAIDNLEAGGSTNGGQGIRLAYDVATENFVKGGVNRVILCTDGDFNVGTTSQSELVDLIEQRAKSGVFLSVLGFGMGNYKDSTMEKLADKGNGNYAYIDTPAEARKVLVEQVSGTLITIAKDVKIQVDFNPAEVAAYRLIGYENRLLRAEDFKDDTKDAGEIGAGHAVTALYELVPPGEPIPAGDVEPSKYQTAGDLTDAAAGDEALTVRLRYKQPDEDESRPLEVAVTDPGRSFDEASGDFQFAAAVAQFGLLLRGSKYA